MARLRRRAGGEGHFTTEVHLPSSARTVLHADCVGERRRRAKPTERQEGRGEGVHAISYDPSQLPAVAGLSMASQHPEGTEVCTCFAVLQLWRQQNIRSLQTGTETKRMQGEEAVRIKRLLLSASNPDDRPTYQKDAVDSEFAGGDGTAVKFRKAAVDRWLSDASITSTWSLQARHQDPHSTAHENTVGA